MHSTLSLLLSVPLSLAGEAACVSLSFHDWFVGTGFHKAVPNA